MKTYPFVLFVARHGRTIAIAIAALCGLSMLGLFAVTDSRLALLAAPVVSGVAWAITRLAAELIEVIAETLLPR